MSKSKVEEAKNLVGRTGKYLVKDQQSKVVFTLQVKIVKALHAYGRTMVTIEPVAGTGQKNVNLDKIEF